MLTSRSDENKTNFCTLAECLLHSFRRSMTRSIGNYLMGRSRLELPAYGSGGETDVFATVAQFRSPSLMF